MFVSDLRVHIIGQWHAELYLLAYSKCTDSDLLVHLYNHTKAISVQCYILQYPVYCMRIEWRSWSHYADAQAGLVSLSIYALRRLSAWRSSCDIDTDLYLIFDDTHLRHNVSGVILFCPCPSVSLPYVLIILSHSLYLQLLGFSNRSLHFGKIHQHDLRDNVKCLFIYFLFYFIYLFFFFLWWGRGGGGGCC